VNDYRRYSFWLETAGEDLTPRPQLNGSIDADVAILGAGYTGLWTAYYLLRRDPSLKVVIAEREIAGFGASGRNGGWCTAGFPVSPTVLKERHGLDAARAVQAAMYDTIDEVGRIAAEESIDAGFHKGGALRLARGRHQLPLIKQAHETAKAFGLADHYHLLDERETAERLRVTNVLGSLFTPDCAMVHPGRLVRGLARAVERCGGTIYEQTPVTEIVPGPRPSFRTPWGEIRARTIVLAGESYLSALAPVKRQVMPIYSLIVLTEPLSASQWDEIGWKNREGSGSTRYSVDYMSHTGDGRILFGGRGAPYRLGSRISDGQDRHAATHRMLRQTVTEWFPMLRDIRFTHDWGGPIGVPRDWMPTMAFDPASGVATARGYTGQGVATANLSGRVLTDLITGTTSPLTALPMVNHRSPNWEPEPLRWLGVRYLQGGLMRVDQQAERSGEAPSGRSLPERLGRH